MLGGKPSVCGLCTINEDLFIHWVCKNGDPKDLHCLCSSCVLKQHPSLFCPICFEVYEESKPPNDRIRCMKCPSVTHFDCLHKNKNVPFLFVCPPCSKSHFSFLDLSSNNGGTKEKLAVHAAAAQIAYNSMVEANTRMKMEANRRVVEAAEARRKAAEALKRIDVLTAAREAKEKVNENEEGMESTNESMMLMKLDEAPTPAGNQKRSKMAAEANPLVTASRKGKEKVMENQNEEEGMKSNPESVMMMMMLDEAPTFVGNPKRGRPIRRYQKMSKTLSLQ